jgi:hypothetical protein
MKIINIMKNVSSTSSFSLNEYYESIRSPPASSLFESVIQASQQSKKTRVGREEGKKQKSDVEMVKTHQIT